MKLLALPASCSPEELHTRLKVSAWKLEEECGCLVGSVWLDSSCTLDECYLRLFGTSRADYLQYSKTAKRQNRKTEKREKQK